MRRAGRVVLAGVLAFGASLGAWAGEAAKTTLAIQGMTCGGCVAAVKVQLKKTEGVTAYEVSLEKAEADVSYDSGKTTPEKIAESVSTTGFRASVKKPTAGKDGGSAGEESLAAAAEGAKRGACCQRDCGKAANRGAAPADEAETPGLVSLAKGIAPLVSDFDAVKDRPRHPVADLQRVRPRRGRYQGGDPAGRGCRRGLRGVDADAGG